MNVFRLQRKSHSFRSTTLQKTRLVLSLIHILCTGLCVWRIVFSAWWPICWPVPGTLEAKDVTCCPTSVSYTHLALQSFSHGADGYRRFARGSGYFAGTNRLLQCHCNLCAGPVSYTHLDVYKRQESLRLECGPPDRSGSLQPLHPCFDGAGQTGRPCVFQGNLRYPRRRCV